MSDNVIVFSDLQPTGRVSFGAIRDGQEITIPLNLTANATVDVQGWLQNNDVTPSTVAMYSDAVILVDGEVAAEIYEWEPGLDVETREIRFGGQGQKADRAAGFKATITMTMYKVIDSRLFQRVVEAVLAVRAIPNTSIQCIYRQADTTA